MPLKLTEWRDWVIVGLWLIMMTLSGFGYNSIKDSITVLHQNDMKQGELLTNWKLETEKQSAAVWRIIDLLCANQDERLKREGKPPIYRFPGREK